MSCDAAAAIVGRGRGTGDPSNAVLEVGACGAIGARAIAAGLLTYSSETDPLALDRFMRFVDAWRDSIVFDAALRLATNSAATPASRVFAVRHLLVLTHPFMRYTYAGLVAGDSTTRLPDGSEIVRAGCAAQLGSEEGDRVGTALPADYESRIRATLAALAAEPSTPAQVRNAARC